MSVGTKNFPAFVECPDAAAAAAAAEALRDRTRLRDLGKRSCFRAESLTFQSTDHVVMETTS